VRPSIVAGPWHTIDAQTDEADARPDDQVGAGRVAHRATVATVATGPIAHPANSATARRRGVGTATDHRHAAGTGIARRPATRDRPPRSARTMAACPSVSTPAAWLR
jgi:hypothetical protein